MDTTKLKAAQKMIDESGNNKLKNLRMISSSEMAREYQRRGVEAKKRNKERIISLKEFWKDFDKAGLEIGGDDVKGVDVLIFLMKKAFYDEDFDLAGQYAEKVAAYQTPKLSAQSVDMTTRNLADLTDEEFEEELRKLEAMGVEDEIQRSDESGTETS